MRLSTPLLCAAMLLPGLADIAAQTVQPTSSRLDFDVVFGDHASSQHPSKLRWTGDGRWLSYLWDDEVVVLDAASGETDTLLTQKDLDPEAEADAELDLDDYHWAPDKASLLLERDGDLFLWSLADETMTVLTETEQEEEDPKFSPDGRHVAFVRDADLFVLDLETGRERALTEGGEEGRILNGKTDWLYWEELWGRDSTGYWWSPASDEIAYYHFDESPVSSYPLVDFTPQYPEVTWQKYPKAGKDNPIVRVGVVDLARGETTWMSTGDNTDIYLPRVDWLPGGRRLSLQRMNRDQNRIDLLDCHPGSGKCSPLHVEELETWVNVTDDLRWLGDGSFLWTSEDTGWKQLYLHGADGERQHRLSPEGWAVSALNGFDADSGTAIFTAYSVEPMGAATRRVFRVGLEGGPARPLSSVDDWSGALVAPVTSHWVHTRSRADSPAEQVVRDAAGAELARLPSRPATGYDPAELDRWELLEIPGPDGSRLPAMLLRPSDFDAFRTYPALMYHYGGPASQVVADRWSDRERVLWHRMMAQRGYAVLLVDNLASNYFGKTGADRLHRRFGEVNLAAQRAAVEYLTSLGWVDAGRIGLWGWSGGGSNTLYSILNSPGTWKAAVAGAPVTDWRLYDTLWTERYLDHPDSNEEGYRLSSAGTHADRLRDKLLIVHGTADDNVHPQNTIALSRKLIDAGVPFEQAIYPRQKHGFRGGDVRHFYQRMTEFFDRHLEP